MALLEINDKMNSEMVRYQRYRAKCANRTAKRDPEVRVITSSNVSMSLKQLQHLTFPGQAFSPDEVLLSVPSLPQSRPVSQVSQDSASSTVKAAKETDFQVKRFQITKVLKVTSMSPYPYLKWIIFGGIDVSESEFEVQGFNI